MKKRLRKKFHKGEFKEIGFEIKCFLNEDIEEAVFDKFIDDFIDVIESKGLVFGGGGSLSDRCWEGVIAKDGKYQCTDSSDKEFISDWLKSRNEIRDFSLGEDIDLWSAKAEL